MRRIAIAATAAVVAVSGLAAWNEGAPKINGPRVYGATPARDFMYAFPTTGDRNGLAFSVVEGKLPAGVSLDAKLGVLTGRVNSPGSYSFTVRADNGIGVSDRPFTLVIGANARALTPPMGWTSWSAYSTDIDQELIAATAKAIK